jgi:hypothetical protein
MFSFLFFVPLACSRALAETIYFVFTSLMPASCFFFWNGEGSGVYGYR